MGELVDKMELERYVVGGGDPPPPPEILKAIGVTKGWIGGTPDDLKFKMCNLKALHLPEILTS